jgi:HD superfamily phosphohydrolase
MYEIVANGVNSIDVDKFDYLARDTRGCNVPSSFDHRRLMTFSRVLDDHVCFHTKEVGEGRVCMSVRVRVRMCVLVYVSVCMRGVCANVRL